MARLTELQDGSDTESGPSAIPSTGKKPEILTQAEREQILFESGVLDKLGLPKDFVTLEEAQAQLKAQKEAASSSSSSEFREQENRRRLQKQAAKAAAAAGKRSPLIDVADSDDEYGKASDDEGDYVVDDTADRLLSEQEANEMSPQVESMLDLLIWTMPFGFMYTLLDILVRQQYGETVGFVDEGKRLIGALPVLAVFIWYNLVSQRKVLLQGILFSISVICGCALIYIVNKSSYDIVIQRVAPLGTLWIFAVVRLDLLPACISLAMVAAYVQNSELKIVFE